MKYQELQKMVLKECIVIAGVIAALGAVTFYLGVLAEDYQREAQALENEVNGINAETNALREKYYKVQQNSALYQEAMKKNSQDGLYINRQSVKETFNHFRSEYFLNNLRLSMNAIEEMKDAKYKRNTNVIVSSEVTVSFDAITDEHIYRLINAMQDNLSGSTQITHLSLTRNSAVSPDILHSISQRGNFPLVKGEMKFIWLGIKPVEVSDAGANAPKPAP